mgnify:CR=1 FL=1
MSDLLDDGFISKFNALLSEELLLNFGYGSKQYILTQSENNIVLSMKTHVVEFDSIELQRINKEFKNEFLIKHIKNIVKDLISIY